MKYIKPVSLFRELVKSNALKKGRFLGLDVGDKYVGLAVSDVNNKNASPLSALLRKDIELMASQLKCLKTELSLEGFIVGYPYNRQRKNCPTAMQVKLLSGELSKTGKLEGMRYTYWDESFTSKLVDLLLKPLKLPPVQSKTTTDKFAAVAILQDYLDYVNRSENNVELVDRDILEADYSDDKAD